MQTGLEAAVCADPRFEVVAKPNRADIASAIRTSKPDVVLLDASEADIRRIFAEFSAASIASVFVVLTGTANRSELHRMLQSGARAILTSDSSAAEIADALQAASGGLAVLSPELLDVLLPASEAPNVDQVMLQEALTSRESEVLALLAEGAGNREIAAALGVSDHTAKFHVSSILSKLGATTRTEAVSRGYRLGLIFI
jgi:DNA-binding NarL/FixJ family response regulator